MLIIRGGKHAKTCIINVQIYDGKYVLKKAWETWN